MKRRHLAIPLLAACICSCNAPLQDLNLKREVSREEVVGVWVLTAHAKEIIEQNQVTGLKPEKSYVKLSADGSCEFHSAYDGFSGLKYLQASGTWVLEHDSKGDSNYVKKNALRLSIRASDFSADVYLNFREESGKLLLWSFHGDPDSMRLIEYVKKEG